MPAHALAPLPGWTVLDACAAPGNKTTHAAARVGARGRVLAFDKDPRRLARLISNSKRAGAGQIITAECADFLALDPTEARFAEVQPRGARGGASCAGARGGRRRALGKGTWPPLRCDGAPPPSLAAATRAPPGARHHIGPLVQRVRHRGDAHGPPAAGGGGRRRRWGGGGAPH